MAVTNKPAEPQLVGLPGREVDVGKPGLHCVDHESFIAEVRRAADEAEQGDPRKGSRYGKHFFTKGYYFRRYRNGYALTRKLEMGEGGQLLELPNSLLERMVQDLGIGVSMDAMLGCRMATLWRQYSADSVGAPALLTICTNEISALVTDQVPAVRTLPEHVFTEVRQVFVEGPVWF